MGYSYRFPSAPSKWADNDSTPQDENIRFFFEIQNTDQNGNEIVDEDVFSRNSGYFSGAVISLVVYNWSSNQVLYRSDDLQPRLDLTTKLVKDLEGNYSVQYSILTDEEAITSLTGEDAITFTSDSSVNRSQALGITNNLSDTEQFLSQYDDDNYTYETGSSGDDTIHGNANNNLIFGEVGEDIIYGGEDDDLLLGQGGDDFLAGEAGNDRLFGGSGNDDLNGGSGDDTLSGGSGNDLLDGGSGDDLLDGGSGYDTLISILKSHWRLNKDIK